MAEFKVTKDEGRESRGIRQCYTFLCDDEPSMMWFPTEHAANRCISRLQQGRSREAFGGESLVRSAAGDVSSVDTQQGRGKVVKKDSEVTTEEVTMKSGLKKVRETSGTFSYELDGCECEETFSSEQEARTACAIKAFMTRGKLGKANAKEETSKTKE